MSLDHGVEVEEIRRPNFVKHTAGIREGSKARESKQLEEFISRDRAQNKAGGDQMRMGLLDLLH